MWSQEYLILLLRANGQTADGKLVLLDSGGSRKNREWLVLLFYPGPPDRVLKLFCFFQV